IFETFDEVASANLFVTFSVLVDMGPKRFPFNFIDAIFGNKYDEIKINGLGSIDIFSPFGRSKKREVANVSGGDGNSIYIKIAAMQFLRCIFFCLCYGGCLRRFVRYYVSFFV